MVTETKKGGSINCRNSSESTRVSEEVNGGENEQ